MNSSSNEHEQAMQSLLRYLLGASPKPVELVAAKEHVAACPRCWQHLLQLTDMLAPAALTAFIADIEAPFPVAPTFAEARQLQRQAPASFAAAGTWQRGRAYLARVVAPARVRAILISLDPQQWPSSPALAHRGAEETLTVAPALQIDDLPDIEASVAILPLPDRPDESLLSVEVSIPSHWPDFGGVRVVLVSSAQQWEQVTGKSGRVTFGPMRRETLPFMHIILLPPPEEDVISA